MLNLQESFVFVDLEAPDSSTVIQKLADSLHVAGMVTADYSAATIDREAVHPTGLPSRPFPIAFPHADADDVEKSALAVAILKEPVLFKNMADPDEDLSVELVIMLANKSPEEQIETLRNLAELFGEASKLTELKAMTDTSEIVMWLKKELALDV